MHALEPLLLGRRRGRPEAGSPARLTQFIGTCREWLWQKL